MNTATVNAAKGQAEAEHDAPLTPRMRKSLDGLPILRLRAARASTDGGCHSTDFLPWRCGVLSKGTCVHSRDNVARRNARLRMRSS